MVRQEFRVSPREPLEQLVMGPFGQKKAERTEEAVDTLEEEKENRGNQVRARRPNARISSAKNAKITKVEGSGIGCPA